ncbi:MAG: hypothetical protein V4498_09670 [candidate division FCPU426 bacterium]
MSPARIFLGFLVAGSLPLAALAGAPDRALPASPSAAALSPLTPTAAVSAPAPALQVVPPDPPQGLKVVLSLESSPEKAGRPMAMLSWQGSKANTFLVKNFRLLKKTPLDPAFKMVPGFMALTQTSTVDPVEIGKSYEYSLIAYDVKGNSSAASAPVPLDLSAVDEKLLAPRAPRDLTATSGMDLVRLRWSPPQAWYAPISSYRVLRDRQTLVQGLVANVFQDLSPTPKTEFLYQVQAVDKDGRASELSLTVTGKATGVLPPGAPQELTAVAKTEKVVLSWGPSEPGTSPISSYLITRTIEPGGDEKVPQVKKVKPLDRNRSSYTDSVEGERFIAYEIRAVDTAGNTSEAATLRTWVEPKPFNRTAVLLMPTAYTNNPGRDGGMNINVLFDFYVGTLYDSYFSERTQKANSGVFQPLQIGTVTGDLKYGFLEETWATPALAAGFYGAAIIKIGSPDSSQSVGASSSGGDIATLGDVYLVASKRFGPRSAVHLGAMRGKLSDDLTALAPAEWAPTLRHLTPGGDFPALMNRFLDPKLGAQVRSAPHLLFAGVQFPFSLLGWKTGLKTELMVPVFPEFPNPRGESLETTQALLPMMLNFHIDNLPLFGFEFSIFQFRNGWEWIAFYHLPDLTWSW